eukprot:3835011-Rhodomonas_salina.6
MIARVPSRSGKVRDETMRMSIGHASLILGHASLILGTRQPDPLDTLALSLDMGLGVWGFRVKGLGFRV